MDFGVVASSSWNAKEITECAKAAEKAELDFLLITDHYMTPRSNQSIDAWTVLASLATQTQRIRLGTCVTPIPFRPPQMLAKMVATVDQLSGGRTILGVGAGWYQAEFDAYSEWDEDRIRVAKTREGIELITRLWTSKQELDFKGRFYSVKGAILEPKPIQKPHPQLWFGTTGAYMLRLAQHYADGWVPPVPGLPVETYEAVLAKLKARTGRKIKLTFNGTLDELRETTSRFADLGFYGAMLARESPEDMPKAIRKLATEIVPSYR
jgi:alkanesulfonate monooxygenase SsuD/methylene tetrahydromethanopterin reductase-like flavin-dependent oxidoreductase (luciferase family)